MGKAPPRRNGNDSSQGPLFYLSAYCVENLGILLSIFSLIFMNLLLLSPDSEELKLVMQENQWIVRLEDTITLI